MVTETEETPGPMTFQRAPVSKSLSPASRICDKGNTMTFPRHGGVIHNAVSGKTLRLRRGRGTAWMLPRAAAGVQCAQVSLQPLARAPASLTKDKEEVHLEAAPTPPVPHLVREIHRHRTKYGVVAGFLRKRRVLSYFVKGYLS